MIANATTGMISQGNWIPRDQDLRIFEVNARQYIFEDVIAGYQFEDMVLLPLGALSELLQIAIEVRAGEASGFIIREDRRFFLDTSRAEVILQGIIKKYDNDRVHVFLGDIYIDSLLLGDWFDMSFDIDLFASRINLHSQIALPLIQRLEREKRISKTLYRINQQQNDFPFHHEPYQTWSMPFVDQAIRLSQRKTESGDTITNYDYSTYATADLIRHEASLYFSGNDDEQADEFRLTLSRKDAQANLLGGLGATEYALGHVTEPRIALINQPSTIEAGFTISNAPLGRQSEVDRNRFIGDLLPGWEVELYRNNVLIGYQAEPVNGQYDFQDVPLLLGNNYFRLEFYGPQGQRRTEESRYNISQSLVRSGDYNYSATVTEDEVHGSRTILQYEAGIAKRMSLAVNLANIPLDDLDGRNNHTYLNAGLRAYWDNFFATFDAIDDSESGDALEVSLQSRYKDIILGVTETSLNGYFSEEFRPTDIELSRRSKYRIDAAIPSGFLPLIPISFEYTRDDFAQGGNSTKLENLISVSTHGVAISNLLTRQRISGQQPTMTGALQLNTSYSAIHLRGTVSYQLDPDDEFTNVLLNADPGQIGDYRISVGLNHSLDEDLTEYSISANKSSGRYNLSLGARHNTDHALTLDASLLVGLGREPRSAAWNMDARNLASSGSASLRVFIDHNQDGIFNLQDEPVSGIGFRIGGGFNYLRTDADGIAFLTGLPVHQPLSINIAPETIHDPLWTVELEGVNVVPRPGYAIQLDFPIFVTGEIDGTVYVERNGRQIGAGRVIVELLDRQSRVVKTTATAFDGFYVISQIPFGNYRLRISDKQQSDLGQVADPIENVVINVESLFQNGLDFVLREAPQ